MNCKNCKLPTEVDAFFCGNCGQQLRAAHPMEQAFKNQPPQQHGHHPGQLAVASAAGIIVPQYAMTRANQHAGETRALLALLFGMMGIVGALFMALLGIGFGILGIVMGTMSRDSHKRKLSTVGMVVSVVAILVGLIVWANAIRNLNEAKGQTTQSSNAAADFTADLSTPCYSLGLVTEFNVVSDPSTCDMNAFNGESLEKSSDAYKVFANKATLTDTASFTTLAKTAIEKDIAASLPGFTIDTQLVAQFAGSPAYIVYASDRANNVTVVEAAVLHKVGTGENIFLLVHASSGDSADLSRIEAEWQWK